jgi:hypothetical protein
MPKFDAAAYPYPECREQHVWKPYDGTIDKVNKVSERIQKCAQCPTKRYTTLSMKPSTYGQIERSSYKYPNDYQVKGGLTISDRGVIRMFNFLDEVG